MYGKIYVDMCGTVCTSECGYAEIRVNIFIRFLDIKYFIKLQ